MNVNIDDIEKDIYISFENIERSCRLIFMSLYSGLGVDLDVLKETGEYAQLPNIEINGKTLFNIEAHTKKIIDVLGLMAQKLTFLLMLKAHESRTRNEDSE